MKTRYQYEGVEILHPEPGHYWQVDETRTVGQGDTVKTMTIRCNFGTLREAQQFIRTYSGSYSTCLA